MSAENPNKKRRLDEVFNSDESQADSIRLVNAQAFDALTDHGEDVLKGIATEQSLGMNLVGNRCSVHNDDTISEDIYAGYNLGYNTVPINSILNNNFEIVDGESQNAVNHEMEVNAATTHMIDGLNFENLFPKAPQGSFANLHDVSFDRSDQGLTDQTAHQSSTPLKQHNLSFAAETISPIGSEESDSYASDTTEEEIRNDSLIDSSDSFDIGQDYSSADEGSLEGYILDLISDNNANADCSQNTEYDTGSEKDIISTAQTFNNIKIFEGANLSYYFEKRNLAAAIDLRKVNYDTSLKDLTDGSIYKSINRNRNRYDVNIILNADGVRIRKTTDNELWIVLGTIAEVPVHLQRSFMIILGVWYGPHKPDMNTYLKPFAEKMRLLDREGVFWKNPSTGNIEESLVRLAVVVCDAPARAMIQNLLYFSGRYGCNICEIRTVKSTPVPKKKRIRVYPYVQNINLRTEERMINQASRVGEKDHVKGVKGPSVLSLIPSVDISVCMVPEYLHSVLIGVVKQVLSIWFNKKGIPNILKPKIAEIDKFLSNQKHPDFVHRTQRQITALKYWKASDFYYYLLFESVPSLAGHLPDKNFQHFLLLVKGIFTLLKSSITRNEIIEADLLLKLFVNNFAAVYGDRELTYNIHQLCHLGLCVQRYGPLFCHSAFPFEDMNGLVARKTHGTTFVDKEIVRNIRICLGIQVLGSIVQSPQQCKDAFTVGELLGAEGMMFIHQKFISL
ncbi:hypothetical protein FOCC_FOCC012453 [Frankliniella occidentalis]|nr:hypothetical protein FOCC_FOCC012453 [Frankliniella occidentalis]